MSLFNYYDELKQKFNLPNNVLTSYNIINLGGQLVYIEGIKGLLVLSENTISFKLKKNRVEVKGSDLFLKNLTEETAIIQGKIYKIEVF